jgi:2-keto-4-pentenoate hydratase/2-oxohepta-3-ene-1,7-dioic acid hydratase in catechol pathway
VFGHRGRLAGPVIRVLRLYPGDIIMTGTCQGVAPVKPGDVMTLAFERIGEMTVAVR